MENNLLPTTQETQTNALILGSYFELYSDNIHYYQKNPQFIFKGTEASIVNDFKNYRMGSVSLFSKESYYIIGFRNLLKKSNFLQLSLQFAEDYITAEEYKDELEKNQHKYVFPPGMEATATDVFMINDILQKIGNTDLTIEEVGEIFSIEPNSFDKKLNELQYNP